MYIDVFDGTETKVYTRKELMKMNPTVEDLEYFIDSASLYLSLAVDMFRFCKYTSDPAEVLRICRTDPDFYKNYTWTKEQRAEFEHIWTGIFQKCLDMDMQEAYHEICIWNAMGTAFNLVDNSKEYYTAYLKLVSDLSDASENNDSHKVNIMSIS